MARTRDEAGLSQAVPKSQPWRDRPHGRLASDGLNGLARPGRSGRLSLKLLERASSEWAFVRGLVGVLRRTMPIGKRPNHTMGDLADELAERHDRGGHLVLVHLTEFVPDYPQTGDQVHDYWTSRPEWRSVHHARHERFRIDILERI